MKRYVKYNSSYTIRRSERKTRNRLVLVVILTIVLSYALLVWVLPTIIGEISFINKFKTNEPKAASVADSTSLAPPVISIPFEATNSATINIKGYSLANSTIEIYVDDEVKATPKAQEDGSFVAENIPLSLGFNNIYGKTIDDQGTKSLASKTIRVTYDNEKPKLEINQPQDNQSFTGDKKITISGTTDSDDTTITINGSRVIISSDGKFSHTLELSEGENTITVSATSFTGSTTQLIRKVTFTPDPTPTPTQSEPTP